MKPNTETTRRENAWMAAIVQYGITLRTIIGLASARRYLLSRCVPLHVVERVLFAPAEERRSSIRAQFDAD